MLTEIATHVLVRIQKVGPKVIEMTAHDRDGNWLMSSVETISPAGVNLSLKRFGITPISRPYHLNGYMCINALKFTTVSESERSK